VTEKGQKERGHSDPERSEGEEFHLFFTKQVF